MNVTITSEVGEKTTGSGHAGSARTAGVVGLGYVGAPLAAGFARRGHRVVGYDIDADRVEMLKSGKSPFLHLSSDEMHRLVRENRFSPTQDHDDLKMASAIFICVPTPLDDHGSPDLSMLEKACVTISKIIQPGQLISVESTSWPGTTAEFVRPILERSGLKCSEDFFLAFSPEREDPGNQIYTLANVPKVVGADDQRSLELALDYYSLICDEVVSVGSTKVAEAAKLLENSFRSVNIALVNELKVAFDLLDIDIWDVVAAARTKPFGYMPFYPGPGVGGHCIPIDPAYLAWKAKKHGGHTQLIDLSLSINEEMPEHIVARTNELMRQFSKKDLKSAKVLLVGLAYKRNIEDFRESPALRIAQLLQREGAEIAWHDKHVRLDKSDWDDRNFKCVKSLENENLTGFSAAIIVTDHDDVDYRAVVDAIPLVLDTRNVCARLRIVADHIFKV